MMGERFVVVGLAKVRAPWFGEVAHWANSSQVPIEFLKSVSAAEVNARLTAGRPVSALLVDGGTPGLDRDLIDTALEASVAVFVVTDPRVERDWTALGATAVLPERFDSATLMACLTTHAQPIRSAGERAATGGSVPDEPTATWRGRLVAVIGGNGSGSSTVAMALSQGLARLPGNAGSVVLADLAGVGDLAMYHDVRDVVPGLQELVEAHRAATPTRAAVRRQLFEIDTRGYSLLLGLRRSRDWTALRPRAVEASIDSLRSCFRVVVADVGAEADGEDETGSVDIEERNGPTRLALSTADTVVVCGDASLKGMHTLARTDRDVAALGVDPRHVVRVINRAPRSPRQRAELSRAVTELGSGATSRLSTIFLPERRNLDVAHGVAGPLPSALVDPITRAVAEVLHPRGAEPATVSDEVPIEIGAGR